MVISLIVRARGRHRRPPGATCSTRSCSCAELGAQVVVDVYQVVRPRGRVRCSRARLRLWRTSDGSASSHGRSALSRVPSSAVGVTPSPAGRTSTVVGRCDRRGRPGGLGRLRRPARGRPARPRRANVCDRLGVVGAEDERADALAVARSVSSVDPLRRRTSQQATVGRAELPGDVADPPDLARVPPAASAPLVDDGVQRREPVDPAEVGERRQPAVGQPAHQREHPRLVGADPDARSSCAGAGPRLAPATW